MRPDDFRTGADLYRRDTRQLMAELLFFLALEGAGHVAQACGQPVPKAFAWQLAPSGTFGQRLHLVARELDRRGLDPVLAFNRALDAAAKSPRQTPTSSKGAVQI